MGTSLATVLLNVLTLVKAGFELRAIVAEVKALEDSGTSQKDISDYLQKIRDAAVADLNEALR